MSTDNDNKPTLDISPPRQLSREVLDQLDEGIRERVVLLNRLGYRTTDSGDGRLDGDKADMTCAIPIPHIAVVLPDDASLEDEALEILEAFRLTGDEPNEVQATVSMPAGMKLVFVTWEAEWGPQDEGEDHERTPVKGCARCGGDHELVFRHLAQASDNWTHWSVCPTTGEPVMMRTKMVQDEGDDD